MAFNATMDRDYCRYWSRSFEQEENQEYCTNLQQTITDAINSFKEANRVVPKQLFIMRDGVGDAQIRMIF